MTAKLAVFLMLVALILLLLLSGYGELLTLDELKQRSGALVALYERRPLMVIAAFMALHVVLLALSLPGAVFVMALAGGAIFGTLKGTLIVLSGLTLGDSLGFLLARYLLKDLVEAKFPRQSAAVQRGVARDGAYYLLALRMTAVMPYFMVNLAMGLTRLPLRIFAPVSFLGLIPATTLYVQAGTSLAAVRSPSDVLSFPLLVTLALLGLLPIAARALLGRKGQPSREL